MELLTFTEAAELIGVSRETIYYYINKQYLTPIRIGRKRKLRADDVQDFITPTPEVTQSENQTQGVA